MKSSNAVRHRGNPSPPTNINNNNGNLAININTTDNDSVSNSNHSTESHTKIHGGRFLRHNIIRRDELLRSNKNLFVLGGALSIVALCLVGMWASNTSMSTNHTNHPRHMHIDHKPIKVYNDIDAPSSHYRERKAGERGDGSTTTNNRVHWNKRPRPRGHTGYINRKENEELFPIPEPPRVQEEMKKFIEKEKEEEEKEEEEPAEQMESNGSEDETKQQEVSYAKEKEKSPQFHVKKPISNDEELVEESEGSEEEESEDKVQISKKQYRKVSKDDDDVENRANDEDSDENEVSPHDKEGNHAISNSLENEVPIRKVVASSAREQQQQTSGRLQPRMLSLEFETYYHRKSSRGVKPLDVNHENVLLTSIRRLPRYESRDIPTSDRFVTIYPDDDEYMDRLESVKKSKKYGRTGREPLEDKDCKPRHEWQKGAFPNCNILHEYELGALSGMFGRAVRKKLRKREGDGDELVKYLAHGYWRDVWLVSKASGSFETEYDKESEFDEEITVLKTLRYRHDFTDRNYDRHRKDALATERLSKSQNVLNIFGYCSNSAIYEYGKGGDIDNKLWPYDEKEDKYYVSDIPSSEKIDIGTCLYIPFLLLFSFGSNQTESLVFCFVFVSQHTKLLEP